MFRDEVVEKIADELERGAVARVQGLEGRARVCARRAAGVAVREFFELRGLPLPGPSAVDLLEALRELPGQDEQVRVVVDHLLTRVDEGFHLPIEVDLLAEAGWLATDLENQLLSSPDVKP